VRQIRIIEHMSLDGVLLLVYPVLLNTYRPVGALPPGSDVDAAQ
jgi:hypothetical protein